MNPPRMVNNSVEANLERYISWSERSTVNRRKEYSIELPAPDAMLFAFIIITHTKQKSLDEIRNKIVYRLIYN